MQERVGHERIVPINKFWSLNNPPPVVLPPNAGMVYGLRDAQGYDSLLTGQYKQFANTLARPNPDGSMDASPPEVGNMVFIQNPVASGVSDLGAMFALTLPTTAPNFDRVAVSPPTNAAYNEDNEMAVYPLSTPRTRARFENADGSPASAAATITYREDGATPRCSRCEYARCGCAHAGRSVVSRLAGAGRRQAGFAAAFGRFRVFRAVDVPAGTHVVTFRYEPASYRVGLYLALLSCFALTFCVAIGTALRRQNGVKNNS